MALIEKIATAYNKTLGIINQRTAMVVVKTYIVDENGKKKDTTTPSDISMRRMINEFCGHNSEKDIHRVIEIRKK